MEKKANKRKKMQANEIKFKRTVKKSKKTGKKMQANGKKCRQTHVRL